MLYSLDDLAQIVTVVIFGMNFHLLQIRVDWEFFFI